MITDSLENIFQYREISESIKNFLLSLDENSETGHYETDGKSYANIDVYTTKPFDECRFEAHKKYIDIQMILRGNERLECTSIEGLEISQKYDKSRDVMFFADGPKPADSIQLEPRKFVLIYPHEAHKPQICIGSPREVKKVVVKIPC